MEIGCAIYVLVRARSLHVFGRVFAGSEVVFTSSGVFCHLLQAVSATERKRREVRGGISGMSARDTLSHLLDLRQYFVNIDIRTN